MRVEIPLWRRSGGRFQYGGGNAILKNQEGTITWTYRGALHRGIGIVACARSGTVYTTKLLNELGYRVQHEHMGEDGSVGYHLAVVKPKNCLHQVRHPLKQINSMVAHKSWGWCDQVLDLPDYELLGCMQYWLMWNTLCEEFCVWRYQIEQLPDVWDEFLRSIGHEYCDIPNIPKDTNTHEKKNDYKDYSWDDLFARDKGLTNEIIKMAKRYGYDTPEMDKVECQNLREPEMAEVAPV